MNKFVNIRSASDFSLLYFDRYEKNLREVGVIMTNYRSGPEHGQLI